MSQSRSEQIDTLLDPDGGLFHFDDLAEAMYVQFGGAKGIALTLYELFHDPKTSPQIKARIGLSLVSVAEWRNKSGADKATADPSGLSDDEIKAAIAEAVNGAQG